MESNDTDMKFITYDQKGGRSGHALKDIFTCYIMSFLIDGLVVLPQKKWNNRQKIVNFDTDESQSKLNEKNFTGIITINPTKEQWNGMSFWYFCDIQKQIESLPGGSLVILKGVIRLHPFQLTEWYNKKMIQEDPYVEKIVPALRNLYFINHDSKTIDCLSMHVRRGDVADPNSRAYNAHGFRRWPVEYFEQAIISFRSKFPNVPINVFSERNFSGDLQILKKYNNLNIILGDAHSLQKDINHMINSRFFMPCDSCLSLWVSYISKGTIIMPEDKELRYFHKRYFNYKLRE